jgi:hypothetical protein
MLAYGIGLTIFEEIVGGYSGPYFARTFAVFCVYMIISTSYFMWKSRKLKFTTNGSETLDGNITASTESKGFPFSTIIGVSNICIALIIAVAAIYVLIANPPQLVSDPEEILRLSILLLGIFYAALKTYYSLTVLKKIKHNSKHVD